jgi:hypothetical protein
LPGRTASKLVVGKQGVKAPARHHRDTGKRRG